METVRIGGRRYTDPDIISLARQTGELICPRFTIKTLARLLSEQLSGFSGLPATPFERLEILASLRGIKIKPMDVEGQRREKRDAVLYPAQSGRRILYNPNRPRSRVLFTLAHEIIHTLFPSSMNGARFRSISNPDSREANELERLCDLGAAELVMPIDEFQEATNGNYGLTEVDRVAAQFGTSFEATAFRMATAHPGFAVAGLLRYRRRKEEEREVIRINSQRSLFSIKPATDQAAARKYRRQSLHLSELCGDEYIVRWNKSFDPDSIVYRARKGDVVSSVERLPNSVSRLGRLEAIIAPYQRDEADSNFSDVLFFWEQV